MLGLDQVAGVEELGVPGQQVLPVPLGGAHLARQADRLLPDPDLRQDASLPDLDVLSPGELSFSAQKIELYELVLPSVALYLLA